VWNLAERADGVEAAGIARTDLTGEGQVVLSREGRELSRIDTGRRFGPYVWFTPDGRRLVVGLHGDYLLSRLGSPLFGGPDGYAVAVIYDVTDPEAPVELARHELDDRAQAGRLYLRSIDAAASPDGSLIALASVNSREVLLVDAESGLVTRRLESAVNVWWDGVDFVDDHTLVGVGNVFLRDNFVLWDTDSGQELHTQSVGDSAVSSVAVDRRSGIMAFGHDDGDLTLFDVESRTQLGPAVNLGLRGILDVEFRDDGQRLLVAYTDAPAVEWDLSREAWKQAVCDVVDRNLTEDESRLYFDGDPSHTSTCPGV
jgi:WD40 repeat protein